jgi:hypothetical protein
VRALRLPVFVVAALLSASAGATEFVGPRIALSPVDWTAASAALTEAGDGTPAEQFARLNAAAEKRFPGIGKSSVPVLLPIDVEALRKDIAAQKPDADTANRYLAPFHPSKFFLPGPAGYAATFWVRPEDGVFKYRYRKPVEIEIGGAAFTYELDGPDHKEVFPAKDLEADFPGIRRILRDAHVRYAFERFGVPYVVSIQCYDRRPSPKYLSCREADPIATAFLHKLRIAGGTPQEVKPPHIDLTRPKEQSPDFTFHSPGDLIPNSGWRKMPGRVDYHVYAEMRFPIAHAPAYVKSQSFMPWGDCYRSGHVGRLGRKGSRYHCKVNGIPLVFDESSAANFTYPWRDNFCELRDFLVGQCPGGYGHQGQDMRPANCVLQNEGADRCQPYQHTVAAVRDGLIWRTPGNLAAYIVVNTANDLARFRYLHMNPKFMDEEGLITGRQVSQGEIIGKVATWGDHENGTSYHLHFSMQVFTKIGWVWVNPYMSLVLAYENMIGARGLEIMPGEPVPPVPDKPPVILNPAPVPAATAEAPVTGEAAAKHKHKKKRKPKRKSRRKHAD